MADTDIALDLGRYKLGWTDAEDYVFKPKRGLDEDIIREMSWMKGEPDWMLEYRLKSYAALRAPADAQLGRRHVARSSSTTSTTTSSRPSSRSTPGTSCPTSIKNTYEKLGIPEAERKYLAGVTAQYESEVVFHRNREDLERAGRHLHRHGHRAARVPRAGQAVLRHGHPEERQQVRRAQLLGVVAAGRFIYVPPGVERRDAAAGLLPHQRREHGPVRAHADHRRRGQPRCTTSRAARRPVYTTDSLHSAVVEIIVKPQRPGHLHDHPELVEQRLQPGHQAGPGRGRGPHGVDRRQHRLAASP